MSAVCSAAMLLTGMMGSVVAEEKNRMLLTGTGHGILCDGKAREQAGVPKEIADYCPRHQGWRDLQGHAEVSASQ